MNKWKNFKEIHKFKKTKGNEGRQERTKTNY